MSSSVGRQSRRRAILGMESALLFVQLEGSESIFSPAASNVYQPAAAFLQLPWFR